MTLTENLGKSSYQELIEGGKKNGEIHTRSHGGVSFVPQQHGMTGLKMHYLFFPLLERPHEILSVCPRGAKTG